MTRPDAPGSESAPVVPRVLDDHEEELRLLPVDCPSRDEFQAQSPGEPTLIRCAPPVPASFQYSVVDLMVVTVGVAVGLAGGTWMPADAFAGIMGILILGGLILVHFFPLESHLARLAWGTFVLAYFVAVLAAMFRPAST